MSTENTTSNLSVAEQPVPETVEIGGIRFARQELHYLPQAMVTVSKMYQQCVMQIDLKAPLAGIAISDDFWIGVQIVASAIVNIMQSQDV